MSNTTNLNLFKHDNPSTNTDPFNIESALNGNWDKIDTYAGNTNTAITNSENSIEALQQENQRLKETLPTTTGSGETITLNKTAEMEFVVPPLPEGNTKQNTTNGYNLLDIDEATSKTVNGVTFTVNEDKSITVNGTASAVIDTYFLKRGITIEPGTYTLSGCPIGGSASTYYLSLAILGVTTPFIDTGNKYTRTINEALTNISCRIFISAGTVCNNLVFKPMFEAGSTAHDFEPYTNGASPNPSYPQEVQVVKGDVEVLIRNKNLFNKDDVSLNKMITGAGGLIDFTGVFSSNYIKVQPNTNYYVNEYIPTVVAFDKDKNALGYIRNANNSATIITPATCEYIKVRMFDNSINMTTALNNAMLNLGSTASSYTPHKEQTLPLTLGDIELCKIGDYKDYFYKSGSKWYLHKEIIKNVFNGTENDWNRVNTNTEGQYRFMNRTLENIILNPSDNGQIGKSLNNLLINQSANYNYTCNDSVAISQEGSVFVYYSDIINYTISEFRNWLTTHNLILYCVLKTPTNTEITDTTLINQLEAIYNAISYEEQTNISGTSSGINPLFDVEAYQSTKLLLEDIINSN